MDSKNKELKYPVVYLQKYATSFVLLGIHN